ncbi:MAG: GNAT family N-acetyltransferase, partial [Chloroflexia bacterium]|nr:GNAT family N-acetyltransferase [Chloroflexia bacterium]
MHTTWYLVEPDNAQWAALIDTLYAEADPSAGQLLPDYFVKTTFARIGGRLLVNRASGVVALLFPRGLHEGQRCYTVRMPDPGALARGEIEALLAPDTLHWHDPRGPLNAVPTHHRDGPFDLGAPEAHELAAIRGLHEAIWGGSAAARYPDDLHSASFQPATSLVARYQDQVVGFLLGFYRFGLAALQNLAHPYRCDLAVESQVMGIAPEARRMGLAVMLKQYQARQVLAQGLDLIHWTVDPLQFGNARLNFGRLRAVAGACYPGYYPFRNS